jgi:hypothetical protein
MSLHGHHGYWRSSHPLNSASSPIYDAPRRSLLFDGTDDSVETKGDTEQFTHITASIWAKFLSFSAYRGFFGMGNSSAWTAGWGFNTIAAQTELQFWVSEYGTATGIDISGWSYPTPWHHIVGTYDGTNERIYLDGVLKDTGAKTWNTHSNAARLSVYGVRIGAGTTVSHAPGYFTHANLDDARIYNRALSANEVAAIYNETRDGGYGGLAKQPTRFHHLSAAAAVTGKGSRTAMFLGVE